MKFLDCFCCPLGERKQAWPALPFPGWHKTGYTSPVTTCGKEKKKPAAAMPMACTGSLLTKFSLTGFKPCWRAKTLQDELLLHGLLFCEGCGKPLTGSASRSKNGVRHFYYHCNHCGEHRIRLGMYTRLWK